ncbi:MAG: hypothetical protein FRX49_01758 [Trebouxia sp. A1-2]|nr:MAG: hypothetical protein FRX49_01758 [Trebouxia sp. A1-2]
MNCIEPDKPGWQNYNTDTTPFCQYKTSVQESEACVTFCWQMLTGAASQQGLYYMVRGRDHIKTRLQDPALVGVGVVGLLQGILITSAEVAHMTADAPKHRAKKRRRRKRRQNNRRRKRVIFTSYCKALRRRGSCGWEALALKPPTEGGKRLRWGQLSQFWGQ